MRSRAIFVAVSILLVLISCRNSIDRGLVAYYPFSGRPTDESKFAQDGIAEGAVLIKDRQGNANAAYRFDGRTATILMRVQQLPALQNSQTISWWYYIDSLPVFSDEWGAGNMMALVDTAKGIGIQFGFRGPAYQSLGLDTWNWGGNTLLDIAPPSVQEWHHCVYTFDGLIHQFYLDGLLKAHSTIKTQAGIPNLLMCGNYPGGDQYFTGWLDDIRIYNRRLTITEIGQLYTLDK